MMPQAWWNSGHPGILMRRSARLRSRKTGYCARSRPTSRTCFAPPGRDTRGDSPQNPSPNGTGHSGTDQKVLALLESTKLAGCLAVSHGDIVRIRS